MTKLRAIQFLFPYKPIKNSVLPFFTKLLLLPIPYMGRLDTFHGSTSFSKYCSLDSWHASRVKRGYDFKSLRDGIKIAVRFGFQ